MSPSRAAMRFGGLIGLVVLIVAAIASGAWRHLSPADLRAHYGDLTDLVRRSPIGSLAVFVLVAAAVTAACLPGVGLVIVLSGALFGTVVGGFASLAGIVLGSTGVFLACRSAASRQAEPGASGRVAALMARVLRHAFSTLLVLRLTPVAPLSLVNIAAGLARVRLAPFVAASLIGSAPSNLVYAGLGAGLRGALQHGASLDPARLADPKLVWPLCALAALAAGAAIVNFRRHP